LPEAGPGASYQRADEPAAPRRTTLAKEARTARLAVVIDADNATPQVASDLFAESAKPGKASVRRIYVRW
jgi:hypothetical protein